MSPVQPDCCQYYSTAETEMTEILFACLGKPPRCLAEMFVDKMMMMLVSEEMELSVY